jgi:hypothetical protein
MAAVGAGSTMAIRTGWRRAPRWARLCVAFGTLLALVGGGGAFGLEMLLARYEGTVGEADLFGDGATGTHERRGGPQGPLTMLLVGVDPGAGATPPRADAIMIAYLPAELDRAYLLALPTELEVRIPASPEAGHPGGVDRLAEAMSHGARAVDGGPDLGRGFALLAHAVSGYTGIARFDAGAIIDLGRLGRAAEVIGVPIPGTGGRAVHPGDRGQLLRAVVTRMVSRELLADPLRLDAALRAVGGSLIFNGRGYRVADFVFALRGLRAEAIQMITLPADGAEDSAPGKRLFPSAMEFFASLRDGTVDTFVLAHPELLRGSG